MARRRLFSNSGRSSKRKGKKETGTSDTPVVNHAHPSYRNSGAAVAKRSVMANLSDSNTGMALPTESGASSESSSHKRGASSSGSQTGKRLPVLSYSECLRAVWHQKKGWRPYQVKVKAAKKEAAKSHKETSIHACRDVGLTTRKRVATGRESDKAAKTAVTRDEKLGTDAGRTGGEDRGSNQSNDHPLVSRHVTVPVLESYEQMISRTIAEGQMVKLSSRTVDLMNRISRQSMEQKSKKVGKEE